MSTHDLIRRIANACAIGGVLATFLVILVAFSI